MTWLDLEKSFHRAVAHSISKKKWLLTFPALCLCGVLIVFCRAVAVDANSWVAMSLAFLPVLLSTGVLLSLGILLIRIYSHEAKQLALPLKRLLAGSLDTILGTIYLSLPPVLLYLLLWIVLGIFYLLRSIPGIGTIFSFGPFLLIFSSLILCLFNLGLLFFVTPALALQSLKRLTMAQRLARLLNGQLLTGLALLIVALLPIAAVVGLLSLAAVLADMSILVSQKSFVVALEWFFVMIPFSALLTPAVVFFFNFATESYWLLQRRATAPV